MSNTTFEYQREIRRKSLHLPGIGIPFLYQWNAAVTLLLLGFLCGIYYLSEILRINHQKPLPIISTISAKLTRDKKLDFAPIYLAIGLSAACYFLPFKAALCGTLLVCFCDSVAALVGMKWGRRKISIFKKTYLGTFAFFLSAFVILLPFIGWKASLITASATSIIEAFSLQGIDNLLLPLLGGLMASQFI